MSTPLEAVRAWRRFAEAISFVWLGEKRSWADHLGAERGYLDEEALIQPIVFPRFASDLLGFEVGSNLAPEVSGAEGKPDFTPADAVTHPFVFETKSSREGRDLEGHAEQVERYLLDGRPRIRSVVLTNLVGIRVFALDKRGQVSERIRVDLRGLLAGDVEAASDTGDARRLADFLQEYSFKELTQDEKLARVRQAPPWNPLLEATDPSWLANRLDKTVEPRTATRWPHSRLAQGQAFHLDATTTSRMEETLLGAFRSFDIEHQALFTSMMPSS